MEFYCQSPPTIAPVAYVLQKQQEDEDFRVVSHSTNPQFRVGPVGVAEGGLYSCFYRLNRPEGIQNSTPSAPVSVNVGGPSLQFLTTISTVIALQCPSDLFIKQDFSLNLNKNLSLWWHVSLWCVSLYLTYLWRVCLCCMSVTRLSLVSLHSCAPSSAVVSEGRGGARVHWVTLLPWCSFLPVPAGFLITVSNTTCPNHSSQRAVHCIRMAWGRGQVPVSVQCAAG